jgi:hypothetical protein
MKILCAAYEIRGALLRRLLNGLGGQRFDHGDVRE